jgi:hypothetical protein
MGNSNSSVNDSNKNDFLIKVDKFATKFLLSNKDVTKNSRMLDLNYCDNMVIMTSDNFMKKFSSLEIDYLSKRTENGIEVDKMESDKIVYFNKDELNKLDTENSTKKRRLCIGIAKFYIRIGQLYASILKTINPMYITEERGIFRKYNIKDKKKIPANEKVSTVQINFCNNRYKALVGEKLNKNTDDKDDTFIFNPSNICKVNVDKNNKTKDFLNQEGMVEFEELFLDKYNYDLGIFDKMSESMEKKYKEALTSFYQAFTNTKDKLPENIKKFSDIKLHSFHSEDSCLKDGSLTKTYNLKKGDKKFEEYGRHLKEMYSKIESKQEKIMDILKSIFVLVKSSDSKEENITINPNLNYESLELLIIQTQDLILKMYVDCESDYFKGFTILQNIIKTQKDNVFNNRLIQLKNTPSYNPYSSYTYEYKPEIQQQYRPEIQQQYRPEIQQQYIPNIKKHNLENEYINPLEREVINLRNKKRNEDLSQELIRLKKDEQMREKEKIIRNIINDSNSSYNYNTDENVMRLLYDDMNKTINRRLDIPQQYKY